MNFEPDEVPTGPVTVTGQAAVGIGRNSYGPITTNVHHHHAPRAVVSLPHQVGVVPPLADRRVDRPADQALTDALTGGGVVALGQVLSGLGGVGKTQLAAGLAHQWWQQRQVDVLVWVTATTRTAVLTRYAQAAADLTGVQDPDPADAAERFLAWLATTDVRWLVVLDDVTDPDDVTGLWPPVSATGRTVATSRRRDHALTAGRQLIDVDVFTAEQAHAYLRDKLGDQPGRLVEAAELAADLGHLPLALAQAAAYIADQVGTTCADYRQQLHRSGLAALTPAALPDEHRDPVAATWTLSIDLADRYTNNLARPVLELAALLDPNAIPVDLFTAPTVVHICTVRPVTDTDMLDVLRVLHRFNLATLNDTCTVLRVHDVVQRTVREATSPNHHRPLAIATADALLTRWPDIERDTTYAQMLRANTTALQANTAADTLWSIPTATTPWHRLITRLTRRPQHQAHPLLFRAGRSLGEAGLVAAAREHFQDLYDTAHTRLGPNHPDTLTARGDLALWRGEAGDPAGAATAFEHLLTDRLRVLGPNHPNTLGTRYNLAMWRGQAGDPAGAATAFEHLLTDCLRVLGPDHPNTLTTRSNLAMWRGQAGDPAGAAITLEQLLTDRLRVLGPDHPDTLGTRNNLAMWRGEAGDPAGAATSLEQLLTDMLRVLGPDHPDTLTIRGNLASWRGQAGDPAGAATTFEHLLTDMLRVLGPDHPDTLATRGDLASWRGEAGDPAGAATTLEELLTDCLRVLGTDHPDTLATRGNIAHWRREAGDPAGAATAFEHLLTDCLRVLGPDHPNTLTTRGNIAHRRGQTGDRLVSAGPLDPPDKPPAHT